MNISKMIDLAINTPKLTMLYGSPGSGKTSIAISGQMKKLLVDLERGASRAIPNDYTDVWTPQSLGELLTELTTSNVKDYDVIVIDTLGRLVELLVKKHSNASGVSNQNTWGSVRRDLMNWWTSLLKLDKHIILTAHGKLDGETYRPEVLGNSPALILRDLDYVGVVKEHKIVFNIPNSWCKNTHSKMADELTIGEIGFLEMILEGAATETDEYSNPISYDKTINNIADIKQLNSTYQYLIDNSRDNSWKKRLQDKCESLNAVFNKEINKFEAVTA